MKQGFTSFNTVELSVIELQGTDQNIEDSRKITSVYGLPFYCSTGINSQFPGTWFPFYGITTYCQFSRRIAAVNIPKLLYDLFLPVHSYNQTNADLPIRFGTLGCLLISSCFGGGLWKTENGRRLYQHLTKKYPTFYDNWPTMLLNPCERIYSLEDLFGINHWLIERAYVSAPKELSSLCPLDDAAVFALQARDQKLTQAQLIERNGSCCTLM